MENPIKPNSALKSLNKLLGTWKASDPSGAEGISGEVTFEWMENNFFFIQHIDFGGGKSFEVIGYDEESNSLKTHYFSNTGQILEYTYEVNDDTITVSIDMPHAKGKFIGKFSNDGNSYTGRWDWTEDGARKGYSATMTKVQPKEKAT